MNNRVHPTGSVSGFRSGTGNLVFAVVGAGSLP